MQETENLSVFSGRTSMMGETRGRMAEMKREGGSLDGKEVRQGGGEEREFPNYSSKQSKSMSPVMYSRECVHVNSLLLFRSCVSSIQEGLGPNLNF